MSFLGAVLVLVLAILAIVDSRIYRERRVPPSGGAIAWSVVVLAICVLYLLWGVLGVIRLPNLIGWISSAPLHVISYAASAIALYITSVVLIIAAIARLAGKQIIPPGPRLALGITMLVLAAVSAAVVLAQLTN